MAIGTITKDEAAAGVGPVFFDRISFAADGSYPTGGTAAFQAAVQAKTGVGRAIVAIIPQDCGGYVPVYDQANDKLKVYYGDYDPAAAGPMVEVPNATNLSAVTFNLVVISY